VWEQAACEQLLAELADEDAQMTARRAALDAGIDARNDALDRELGALRAELTVHVDAQRTADRTLREGVARIEGSLRAAPARRSAHPR
jgi:uncharacterized protein involved in exopolysaccharide biosynthesis